MRTDLIIAALVILGIVAGAFALAYAVAPVRKSVRFTNWPPHE